MAENGVQQGLPFVYILSSTVVLIIVWQRLGAEHALHAKRAEHALHAKRAAARFACRAA